MSNGTGNYFMNLPKFGESGGQILPQNLPTGTGTSGANYESTGTTNAFQPYNFFGGKKRTKKRRSAKKRRRISQKNKKQLLIKKQKTV